jgi:hypothetical protein
MLMDQNGADDRAIQLSGSSGIRRDQATGVMHSRVFHRYLFSLISYQGSAISGDT